MIYIVLHTAVVASQLTPVYTRSNASQGCVDSVLNILWSTRVIKLGCVGHTRVNTRVRSEYIH